LYSAIHAKNNTQYNKQDILYGLRHKQYTAAGRLLLVIKNKMMTSQRAVFISGCVYL